jgi:hypothetical protein
MQVNSFSQLNHGITITLDNETQNIEDLPDDETAILVQKLHAKVPSNPYEDQWYDVEAEM